MNEKVMELEWTVENVGTVGALTDHVAHPGGGGCVSSLPSGGCMGACCCCTDEPMPHPTSEPLNTN